MICPVCHRKDNRSQIELIERSENGKAWKCHVCGSYVCPRCAQHLISVPAQLSWDYPGRVERLHTCKCQRMYLVVQKA